MPSDSTAPLGTYFNTPGVSEIHPASQTASVTGAPASYYLLLAFLFLLYANLPFILPASEVVHPAKVVAGAALVMLLVETIFGRRTLSLAWPEGACLLGFCGVAALSLSLIHI